MNFPCWTKFWRGGTNSSCRRSSRQIFFGKILRRRWATGWKNPVSAYSSLRASLTEPQGAIPTSEPKGNHEQKQEGEGIQNGQRAAPFIHAPHPTKRQCRFDYTKRAPSG